MQQLKTLINIPQNQTLRMIYQASRDGFSSSIFHSKCNGVLGTLTVIKSNSSNNIFGGYTQADWSGYNYRYDSNAFLFSLTNAYNTPVKLLLNNPESAIYSYPSYGPTFGNGHDFHINSDGSLGYSNLGYAYQLPSFLSYGTTSAQSFLAGSYSFTPIEIESYAITPDRNKYFLINNFKNNILKITF
jgi:hypothetical protein